MTDARGMESVGRQAMGSSEPLDLGGRMTGDLTALDDFARELGARPPRTSADADYDEGFLPRRINADRTTVEKDLARVVLALVDLVRQLMERQAIRRVNGGSLSDDEIERMGETFLRLDRRMAELRTVFGFEPEDLALPLGPIQDLL